MRKCAAAIGLWFYLRQPSCSRGFKSQARHLGFFQFVLFKFNEIGTKINKMMLALAYL